MITAISFWWSSMSPSNVSTASWPKSACTPSEGGLSVYASSMNSAPRVRVRIHPGCAVCGLAHEAGHEVSPGGFDEVRPWQHPEGGQQPAVEPGYRGLAGMGRAGEDQVCRLQPASGICGRSWPSMRLTTTDGALIAAASCARPAPAILSRTSPRSGSSAAPSSAASSTSTSGPLRSAGQNR
jgi:hypothetical protein